MDEDAIVHEIIKSLAFEIEAVNKDNVLKWSTTNGTPLNVKVRVRNKDEPRLVQRGAVPVPKIGITTPEKLRLISSDQTILSFNVCMEDDFAKQEDSRRRNVFKLFSIGGCLGTYSDDEEPYLPGSSKQNAIGRRSSSKSDSGIVSEKVAQIKGASDIVPRKHKGFFGKCKGGGCLDPPLGEDKYPYVRPKTNRQEKPKFELHELPDDKQYKSGGCLDPPFSEDKYPYAAKKTINEEKVELSEPEDNNLAHSISIHSPKTIDKESGELRTSIQKTKNEVDPKRLMDIYARTSKEKSLTSKYSNSIITYHTDISSTETIVDQLPTKRKSVRSYDEESQKQSYDSSYFVPPKNVLRYKEAERRYSRELSNDQSRNSTRKKSKENSAITPREKDKVKLAFTEPQVSDVEHIPNKFERKQNDNGTLTDMIPNFIETASYVQTGTTKIDSSTNVSVKKLKSDSEFSDPKRDEFSAIEIEHKDKSTESHQDAVKTIGSSPQPNVYNAMMDGSKNVPVKTPKSNIRRSSRNSLRANNVESLKNTIDSTKTDRKSVSSRRSSPDSKFSAEKRDDFSAIRIEHKNKSIESHPDAVILIGSSPQEKPNAYNSNMDDIKNLPVRKPKSNIRRSSRNSFGAKDVEYLKNTNNFTKADRQSMSSRGSSPDSKFPAQKRDKFGSIQIEHKDKLTESGLTVDSFAKEKHNVNNTKTDGSINVPVKKLKLNIRRSSKSSLGAKDDESLKNTINNIKAERQSMSSRGSSPDSKFSAEKRDDFSAIQIEHENKSIESHPDAVISIGSSPQEKPYVNNTNMDEIKNVLVRKPKSNVRRSSRNSIGAKDVESLRNTNKSTKADRQSMSSRGSSPDSKFPAQKMDKSGSIQIEHKDKLSESGLTIDSFPKEKHNVNNTKTDGSMNVPVKKPKLNIRSSRSSLSAKDDESLKNTINNMKAEKQSMSSRGSSPDSKCSPGKRDIFSAIQIEHENKSVESHPDAVISIGSSSQEKPYVNNANMDEIKNVPVRKPNSDVRRSSRNSLGAKDDESLKNTVNSTKAERQSMSSRGSSPDPKFSAEKRDIFSAIEIEHKNKSIESHPDAVISIGSSPRVKPNVYNTNMDEIKKVPVIKPKSNIRRSSRNSLGVKDAESLKNTNKSTKVDRQSMSSRGSSPDSKFPVQERDKFGSIQTEHKLVESYPDAVVMIDSFPQGKPDVFNMHEQINATTDLYNRSQIDIDQLRTCNIETIKKEPQRKASSSNIEILDGRYVTKVKESDSSTSILPHKKSEVAELNVETTKESVSLPIKLDTSVSQPISKIIQSIRPEVVATQPTTSHKTIDSRTEKLPLNLEDQKNIIKENTATLTETYSKFQSNAVKKIETVQNEHKNISHDNISTTEDVSTVKSKATNEDSVIVHKDLDQRDKNIKRTPDSTHKIMSAILQKTPFVTRHDSDIHNDEVNKTIPPKRNTFTIIGSDTSLLKREEDEEITENIPEVLSKSTDKAQFGMSGHKHNKLNVLGAQNKIPDNNILTSSDVTSTLNNVKDDKSDIHLKTTNKPISFDESRNNMETFHEGKKQGREENKLITDIYTDQSLENIKNISTSNNQAEVLVDQPEKIPENRIYPDIYFPRKPISTNVKDLRSPILDDGESAFTVQKSAEIIFMDVNNQKLDAKNDEDNITSLSLTTHKPSFAADPLKTPISENMWDIDSKITKDDSSAGSTHTLDKIKNLGTLKEPGKTMNKDYSEAIFQKQIPEYLNDFNFEIKKENVYASDSYNKEFGRSMNSSDINLTQKSKSDILNPKVIDSNKSFPINQKHDEAHHLSTKDEKMENITYKKPDSADYTEIFQKPITGSNVTDYDLVSDEAGIYELYNVTDIESSQKLVLENMSNLYSEIIDDEENNISMPKHYKLEMEGITYTDVDTDPTQKFTLQDLKGHQQPENSVYINSNVHDLEERTSGNGQILDPVMTRKSSENSKVFVHEELDSVNDKTAIDSMQIIRRDNLRVSHFEIADDGKFVFSDESYDETDILDQDTKQPQSEIGKDSNAPNLEKTSFAFDIGADGSYGTNYQNSTTVETSFYTDTKTNVVAYENDVKTVNNDSVYNSTEFKEKGSMIVEVLSNISEHFEGEEKVPADHVGHNSPIDKSNMFSQFYETLDSKPADMSKKSGSTVTTNSDNITGLNIFKSNYNVPRNTLVNTSMSTLKLGTDEDKNNRTITEALESIKYLSDSLDQKTLDKLMDTTTSNIVSSGTPFDEEHEGYQWPKHSIEFVKKNRGGKPLNINYDKAFSIYGQSALTTQKEMTSPRQQVMLQRHLIQRGVPKANLAGIGSISLEKNNNPLYLDMSFYSYINEKNERIIQTNDPLTEQKQQHDDGTVTVIKTLIRHGNEIRIPVDKDNDLAFNIVDTVDNYNKDAVTGSITNHIRREKHEVDRTSKRKAVLNKNLALIYESELMPLHNAIKDLTKELNTLTVKREMLQEKKRNVNRTKSLRLIPVKRCGCRRL